MSAKSVGRNSIACPACSTVGSLYIIDSRWTAGLKVCRRRYECDRCGHRFTTYESFADVLYEYDPAEDEQIYRFLGVA